MSVEGLRVELEREAYRPGERVRGQVVWTAGASDVASLTVRLVWRTKAEQGVAAAGKADEVTEEQPVAPVRFDFEAPEGPWSFAGPQASLGWAVEARARPGYVEASAGLVLGPDAGPRMLGEPEDADPDPQLGTAYWLGLMRVAAAVYVVGMLAGYLARRLG